jgi:hypothetical protein
MPLAGQCMEAEMIPLEHVAQVALIGAGATAVMDLGLWVQRRLKLPTSSFGLVGRWFGHMARGQFAHEAIAKAAPVKGELALGWLVHYATGIAFAGLLVGLYGTAWAAQPTVVPALCVGIGTVLAPLFLMQPAMGAGIASSRTATPLRNCLRSLFNHAVFGAGLYLAALVVRWALR